MAAKTRIRTQVGIVGAGPAGLTLNRLLAMHGIESVILERKDRKYVEGRIRAGVLEQGTVDLLDRIGVGQRMQREGLSHRGFDIALNGHAHYINLEKLTGKRVTVYGQTEITRDLIEAILADDGKIIFEADNVHPGELDAPQPRLTFEINGQTHVVECDFIAGCDGFYGPCRQSMPGKLLQTWERDYPFAWLGILAEAPPPSNELIYARHTRGFALFSMRSADISRIYLQCDPGERLENWTDEQIWDELRARLGQNLGSRLVEGDILDRSITPMRSFVAEPMCHGNLFLAGDAGHIVPPTGAKGLNLAIGDVHYLAEALSAYYEKGEKSLLDRYSDTALARVWKAQRFSWWMTSILHQFPDDQGFWNRIKLAELDYLLSSHAAKTSLAENYVGLPF